MSDQLSSGLKRFCEEFEREPLAIGVHCGVVWATAESPAVGINGYAMVPEGHPWSSGFPKPGSDEFGWAPLDEVLTVHGGVTYAQHPWIGFDTAHAWDWWPAAYDKLGISSRYLYADNVTRWTPEKVIAEAMDLARQVSLVEQGVRVPYTGEKEK